MMHSWNAVAFFCEDVRDEVGNKVTVCGILPDNLNVPRLPTRLIKLGIYCRIHVDPLAKVGAVNFRLRFPNGREDKLEGFTAEAVEKSQRESLEKGAPYAGFVLTTIAIGLPIEGPGRLEMISSVGEEDVVCAAINIQAPFSSETTASVQPASQSQPASQPTQT